MKTLTLIEDGKEIPLDLNDVLSAPAETQIKGDNALGEPPSLEPITVELRKPKKQLRREWLNAWMRRKIMPKGRGVRSGNHRKRRG